MAFFVIETLVIGFLLIPMSIFLVSIYILAALGKSLGFRKKYVELLIYIFEYGKTRIDHANKLRNHQDGYYSSESDPNNSDDSDVDATEDANRNRMEEKDVITNLADNKSSSESVESKNEIKPRQRAYSTGAQISETKIKGIRSEGSFNFDDIFDFVQSGIDAIVDDDVTKRFVAEDLKSWNLLTRTNHNYEFISWRLSMIWVAGFFVRYFIMFPMRLTICIAGTLTLTFLTFIIGLLPDGWSKKKEWNDSASKFSFRLLSRAFSAIVTYHQVENKPSKNGLCVANHTSPIDVVLLACDTSYAMIGQRHGGFLGILQRALARASSHIWFERSEMKDRESVAKRLKEHVEDETKLPILIFPEGTCINNSAVMQFKKGSFEVGGVIYPVAIKYDPRFGDPFWNSSEYSMLQYLYMMMTSWAIVCDVWYLPPMTRKTDEGAVEFANRVKAEIALKGGLIDLDWDGQLKRAPAKKEWKEKQQQNFAKKFTPTPRPRRIVPSADIANDSLNPST